MRRLRVRLERSGMELGGRRSVGKFQRLTAQPLLFWLWCYYGFDRVARAVDGSSSQNCYEFPSAIRSSMRPRISTRGPAGAVGKVINLHRPVPNCLAILRLMDWHRLDVGRCATVLNFYRLLELIIRCVSHGQAQPDRLIRRASSLKYANILSSSTKHDLDLTLVRQLPEAGFLFDKAKIL